MLIRKTASGKVAGALSYVLSDATVDRYGDVIEPDGWLLDNFRRHPVALFNHNPNLVVGNWRNIRVEDDRLLGDFEPAPPGTTRTADDVRRLIEADLLAAVSVGFRSIESEPIDPKRPAAGTRYTRQELLETSIVSVPANPSALHLARSLGVSDDTINLALGTHAVTRREVVTATGAPAAMKPRFGGTSIMEPTISNQIENRQARLNAARDQLAELTKDPEYDVDTASALNGEIDEQESRLVSLKDAERRLGLRTQQQEVLPPAVARRPLGMPSKDIAPGDLYLRAVVSKFTAYARGISVDQVLAERYPDHEPTQVVTRAAIAGATTTTAGWALELVQIGQAEFVNSLMPEAVFPKLAARGMSLTFGPNAGAIKIPSRAATPSIGASFVAESAPIPVRRLGTTSITLYPHKVGGISVFSPRDRGVFKP